MRHFGLIYFGTLIVEVFILVLGLSIAPYNENHLSSPDWALVSKADPSVSQPADKGCWQEVFLIPLHIRSETQNTPGIVVKAVHSLQSTKCKPVPELTQWGNGTKVFVCVCIGGRDHLSSFHSPLLEQMILLLFHVLSPSSLAQVNMVIQPLRCLLVNWLHYIMYWFHSSLVLAN